MSDLDDLPHRLERLPSLPLAERVTELESAEATLQEALDRTRSAGPTT